MKEIVIISGKGGTGKTTITGGLAALMKNKVIADCDVDAADLHLILAPKVIETHGFTAGVRPVIDEKKCTACGACAGLCRFDAIEIQDIAKIDGFSCEGCGVCAWFCPEEAISLKENLCGEWFVSETCYGPLVHAQIGIGEENSGKLVSIVKRKARQIAGDIHADFVLVDGPPGVGCPVIASLSNAYAVLIVTEPTLSGLHDLERVIDLARHFKLSSYVCINKWDINAGIAAQLEEMCSERDASVISRIPFDPAATKSLVAARPVVGYDNGPMAGEIKRLLDVLLTRLN
jgi:MinD superfamily P-loop ATPase